MNGIPNLTLELLAQCALLALILERALAVVFTDPAFTQNLAKLPSVAALPGATRFPAMPRLPLRDASTLGCAYMACQTLPIGLAASLKPGVLPPEFDALVGALFITGLAQLLQDTLSRLRPSGPVAPAATAPAPARLRLEQDSTPATEETSASSRFKLGGLGLRTLRALNAPKALKTPTASDN